MPSPVNILLRSPEITLKRRNQSEFWSLLRENVQHYLDHAGISWPVKNARARLDVDAGTVFGPELEKALGILERVAGVDSLAAALRLPPERSLIEDAMVASASECYEDDRSFAVRVHRVDKRFPLTSSQMEVLLGDAIRERTSWDRVDLSRPHRTFYVDIYREAAFVYHERLKGVGGLPVGVSGRVLSLLSGGIDSPVASFLLARRGARIDWFHMSASHVTEVELHDSVVSRIAKQLSRTTLRSRLFVVPYTHFDLALRGGNTGYEPVLFRRFLFRAAEELARRIGSDALGTGDSLAQVASQTMENIVASSKAIEALVLRPLVGLDKQQIMDLARRIGTYEISIEPYKDCCALYSRRVRTRARHEALEAIEKRVLPGYDDLIRRSLDDLIWAEYDCGDLAAIHSEACV
ncbi:MAG TPA: tRNA uracil 4-sulfurtransferase ThiI [Vicinamibacteria bacterium]|nr:tRNA uracil 4-sulfurtransferase ThiI [Vicinamibacteria bacterium]